MGARSANHSGKPPGPVWSHFDFFLGFSVFSASIAPVMAAPAPAPPAAVAAASGIMGAGSGGNGAGSSSGGAGWDTRGGASSCRCGMDSGEIARFFSARPIRPGERLRGFSLTLRLKAFRLAGGICRLLLRRGLRRLSRLCGFGLLRLRLPLLRSLERRSGVRRRSRPLSFPSLLSRLRDFSLRSFLRLSRSLLRSSTPRLSRGPFRLLLLRLRLLLRKSRSRSLTFSFRVSFGAFLS